MPATHPALFAIVLFVVSARAQLPAPFDALQRLEITGSNTFERAQILRALAMDAEAMHALGGRTGSVVADAAEVLAERVRAGYRSAGFADAVVVGSALERGLQLTIEEGTRRRCGVLHCTGNTALAGDALREALRDEDGEPIWREGDFVQFDDGFLRKVERAMVAAYRNVGRHGIRVRASWAREDEHVGLTIAVEHEGHEVRVQGIDLRGETAAGRDAALARFPWSPGTLLTSGRTRQLEQDLAALGRYRSIVVAAPDELPAEVEAMPVTVQVLPQAPEPGTPAARDVEQAQAGLRSFVAQLRDAKALRVTFAIKKPVVFGMLAFSPGTATLDLGGDSIAVRCDRMRVFGGDEAPGAFTLTPRAATLAVGQAVFTKHTFDAPVGIATQVHFGVSDDGERELRWGIGVSTKGSSKMFVVNLNPGYATALATGDPPLCQRDGEDLLLGLGEHRLRIGPDGALKTRLLGMTSPDHPLVSIELVDAQVDTGAVAEPAEGAHSLVESLAAMAISALQQHLAGATEGRPEAGVLLRRSLAFVLDRRLPRARATIPDRFVLRASGPSMMPQQIASVCAAASVACTRCTWLASLFASGWGLATGGRFATDARRRLAAMADDASCGPIALSAACLLAGMVPQMSDRLDAARRQRDSFAAFHGDVMALIDASDGATQAMRAFVADWRREPALASLFADLAAADPIVADRAAFRQAMLTLWDAGLGALVRDWLLRDD